jgi:UDP:flavonoid glycosyltransferase YjiC (YdhE family)
LSEEVAEFCAAGAPPVAFTFGTGMMHARELFAASLEACQRLGVRGIFLTKFAEQLPALPASVKHVAFAPFRELFPRCAAVVHHGGVGTVAKALAAGVPQVILPLAYDQKDNAIRVKRLGAGDWVRAGRVNGRAVADKLRVVMGDDFRARCAALAGRFSGECALEAAAREVEGLVHDR